MVNNKASKAEWLCAALIDIFTIVYIIRIIYYLCSFLPLNLCDTNTDNDVILHILFFLLLVSKDLFFGQRSFGKHVVGIAVEKENRTLPAWLLLLRNLPLALFYVHFFLPSCGIKNLVTENSFVFYYVLEMLCVNFTGKTIGDHICGSELTRKEAEQTALSDKFDNRTVLIVTCMILFFLCNSVFFPCLVLPIEDFNLYKDMEIQELRRYVLLQDIKQWGGFLTAYSFFIYKLFKPKGLKIAVIAVMALMVCIKLFSNRLLEAFATFIIF